MIDDGRQTPRVRFEQMWAELVGIGRDAGTGGYHRAGWTPAYDECVEWFRTACAERGLTVETDRNGNLVGWWGDPGLGGVITGSHLDSVPNGGAYDGPLGVVSALAAVDALGADGFAPARPLGVAVFAEEEGSRFGQPCLGSRLLTGSLRPDRMDDLRDGGGQALREVVPDPGPSDLLCNPAYFVELHIEQGRALANLDAPVGVASGIWPHGRWRVRFDGQADHAGTARMEDRRDPVLGLAMATLAANKQARLAGARATVGRIEVAPNATNAVAGRATGWLDLRASDEVALAALLDIIDRQVAERAERDGTTVTVSAESSSGAVAFDPVLRDRVAALLDGAPVLATQAGHDAGVLQAAGVASAMVFVRNPTGVSHAPAEHAEAADCLAGVRALATVLAELAGSG